MDIDLEKLLDTKVYYLFPMLWGNWYDPFPLFFCPNGDFILFICFYYEKEYF